MANDALLYAGVDVGGRRKGFHVAVLADDGIRECCQLPKAQDVADWLMCHGPALTAVDSPRTPAPDGCRSRPCEREFRQADICGIRFTPDRATIEARTDAFYEWIENGFELYIKLESVRLTAIECFPTASWTVWAGKRGGTRRAPWTKAALDGLELRGVPSRTNQDIRDAIAAALTARQHDCGGTRSFDDLVVPHSDEGLVSESMTNQ